MSLKDYESLDLTKKSDIVKDLFERVSAEGNQSTIVLTPVYWAEGTPAFLTQEMSVWFASWVLPYRSGAIEDVYDQFKRRNLKLFEQEADNIENKKLRAIANERALLNQNNQVQFLKTRFVRIKQPL